MMKLDVTHFQAKAGWYLDRSAIKDACKELKIELPVIVRFSHSMADLGTHICREPGVHVIKIRDDISAGPANRTLWHELAHAHQSEYYALVSGQPSWEFYKIYLTNRGPRGASYAGNNFEIEAREIANAHSNTWLVYQPSRR